MYRFSDILTDERIWTNKIESLHLLLMFIFDLILCAFDVGTIHLWGVSGASLVSLSVHLWCLMCDNVLFTVLFAPVHCSSPVSLFPFQCRPSSVARQICLSDASSAPEA